MVKKLQIEAFRTISDLDTLKILTDPMRLEILRAASFANKNGRLVTVKELAEELELSATKLYYHINLMEEHDLIEVADTQVVSGIIEKHYQVTAYQFGMEKLSLADQPGSEDDKLAAMHSTVSDILEAVSRDLHSSLNTIFGLVQAEKEGGEAAPEQVKFHIMKEEMFLTREQYLELIERMEALHLEYMALANSNVAEERDGLHFSFAAILNPNYHLTYKDSNQENENDDQ